MTAEEEKEPPEAQARGLARNAWGLLLAAVRDWKQDDAGTWGAAVAFYAAFSLAPILLVAVAGLIWQSGGIEAEVVSQIRALIGDAGADTVVAVLESARESEADGLAAVLGLGALLFSASAVFGQLQKALNRIWEVAPDPKSGMSRLIRARLLAFGVTLAIGFLLLVSLVASAAVAAAARWAGRSILVFGIPGRDELGRGVGEQPLGISRAILRQLFA